MSGAKLPVSAITSLTLHAGIFGLYFYFAQAAKKENLRVISNVDLMIQVRKPVPQALPKAATPPSTWNFLKMALPSASRVAMPQQMDIKIPEVKKAMMKEPERIDDKGRLKEAPKLQALDLSQRRVSAATIEEKIQTKSRAAALAQAPRLEEVGTRQVRNLPAAIALEERRQEAVAMQRIEALAPQTSHRAPSRALAVLKEASPDQRGRLGDKLASLLPERVELQRPQAESLRAVKPEFKQPVAAAARKTEALGMEKKKSVQIEGPLADRKIGYYEVPEFPAWARA